MSYKIDLHTHSYGSPDGSLRAADYQGMLESGKLDYIAITDHDTVKAARAVQAELGERIIVGEEVTTQEGEIIGLYLKETILPGMSMAQTVAAIGAQQGLIYVPHPFETVRKGISLEILDTIARRVDIVEIWNGRAVFQNRSRSARVWAATHGVVGAASSDAHGWHGWGQTYTIVGQPPTRETLPTLLRRADYQLGPPGLRGILYPKVNRVRKRFMT